MSHNAEKLKGGPLWGFSTSILSQNTKKSKGEIFIFGKSLAVPKKLKGGPFGIFQHPFCRKTSKKCRGTLWGKFFFRKTSLAVPKKIERGDPLVSPGMVCYAGKQEKPFWFSSLGQMVQYYFVELLRTILVSSCGLKKRHYNSRVSLHEAPTKNTFQTFEIVSS